MSEADFVAALARDRISLWPEGDAIRYRAPEGALPEALRGEIARRREGLLAWLRRRGEGVEASGPLSYAQLSHWLHQKTVEGSSVAHVAFALDLRGALDEGALRGALDAVVARHAALRTTYGVEGGGPSQRVYAKGRAGFERKEVAGKEALRAALDEAYRAPFDLERGPVFRAHLFVSGPDEHTLLLVVHHIAADAWSLWLLVAHLERAYAALAAGRAPPPAGPEATYLDFVERQRELVAGARGEELLRYWREELEGAPRLLDLPTDLARPAVARHRGGSHTFTIDAELARTLASFARGQKATLPAVLLAAWQATLWLYSGQPDLLVGCPAVGRDEARFAPVVGDFVNLLPLRARFGEASTFSGAVREARHALLRALEHQECPFARIVDDLRVARDAGRPPLVQAAFVMQKPQQGAVAFDERGGATVPFAGLTATPFAVAQQEGRFDLTLDALEAAGEVRCTLKFDRDCFYPETINRLAGRFLRLLKRATAEPDVPLCGLDLLAPEEKKELIFGYNDSAAPFPRDATVPEVVEAQAARAPGRVAVSHGEQYLSYGELNRRANRLARHLRSLGVGEGVRVAVCVGRSPGLVVALLGVLKSGAAYVPLDPEYPTDRLEFMMNDAAVPVLVTTDELSDRVASGAVVVVSLDDERALAAQGDENLSAGCKATSPAYVMYTSGSTGGPKGAVVTHRAIQRLVYDRALCPLDETDVVAQVANASFDAATFEIWGALAHGARVDVVDRHVTLAPDSLAEALAARGMTAMFLTARLFHQVAHRRPDAFAPLRHLLVGGERLDPKAAKAVLDSTPPGRLINAYGPTETTTFASWHLVAEVRDGAASVPIGRPIANTQLYVLDGAMRPVPVGVRGELYIGGDGVARGYLNRPALTEERFLADPFAPAPAEGEPGPLLYKTGDVVRRLEGGAIDFVGRNDGQVKVRGFRVELGEVEAILSRCPAVEQAAVVAADDELSSRLVAYVVAKKGSGATSSSLRDYARGAMPEHMVPSAFALLEALPMNVNGKIDRAALPPALPAEVAEKARPAAPGTELERRVAEAWGRALGSAVAGPVGLDDNFFDVGGDSIRMVHLHGELQTLVSFPLPIVGLFDRPTVREMASFLRGAPAEGRPGGREEQRREGQGRLRQRLEQRRGRAGGAP